MNNRLHDQKLRRLSEDIANYSPDLAEVLCQNGIPNVVGTPSERTKRLDWLKKTFPPRDEAGPLFS
jgi:hypothetical protein